MRVVRVLAVSVVVLGSVIADAWPAAAAPSLTVIPSTDLAGGDQVAVQATGLPPGVNVRVIQCDQFNDDVELDCRPDLASAVADGAGGVAVTVTLADPVFRSQPFGDPVPVYCRADVCRIFLVWTDAEGAIQALASAPLEFVGSPATITAAPSTNLRRKQWVQAAGTAFGAQGRTIAVVEEACFSLVQGSGCYGTSVLGSGTVRPDGTWGLRVRVRRFLADGTDCADNILGQCQLTARILDASGQPDDSFGVARIGDPGVPLSFRS
ncbi:MAG TPA: neocarzinostatin apoprotein domain-containing protein [Streptosporangiaceae bacterium]